MGLECEMTGTLSRVTRTSIFTPSMPWV